MARPPYPEEVAFDAPVQVPDGHGGIKAGFAAPEHALQMRARFRYLRGGETVQAARLQGRQPIVVTVRYDPALDAVTTDWRMRDEGRADVAHNIRSGPVRSDDGLELEFTVERGVAV